jgi:N-acetylmuramoyl-L-alanine amidase
MFASIYTILMVKNSKYFTLISILLCLIMAFVPKNPKGKAGSIKTIVIDAGHGGKDPGCNGTTFKEKDVSLAVALKLGKILESQFKDVKVIYTRETDVFVDLESRAQVANKAKADLFISIHCNAAGKAVMIKDKKTGKMRAKTFKNKKGKIVVVETANPEPFGTETYVMGLKNEEGKMKVAARENSVIFLEENYQKKYDGFDPESEESYIIMSNYTSSYVIQSANLAVKIQEEYKSKAGRIDKGVHRQSIWVLWRTSMPSILTEIGYLTNPLEEQFLGSENGQDYLAKSIFRGLRKYKDELEGNKKEYNDEFENQTPLENENIKAGNPIYGKKQSEKQSENEEEKQNGKQNEKEGEKEEAVKSTTTSVVKVEEKTKEIKPILDSVKPKEVVIIKEEKLKTDSVSAKDIASQYIKKTDDSKEKEIVKTPTVTPIKEVILDEAIIFKVQFLGSDKEINLKKSEYKKIENGTFYKAGAIFKYVSGNFSDMGEAAKHQAVLKEEGFKDAFIIAMRNGVRMDLNEAKRLKGIK